MRNASSHSTNTLGIEVASNKSINTKRRLQLEKWVEKEKDEIA